MSSALRGTPTEAFSPFVPLGTPPSAGDSDDDDDSDSDEDSDDDKDKDDKDKKDDDKDKKDKNDDDSDSQRTCAALDRLPGLTDGDLFGDGG